MINNNRLTIDDNRFGDDLIKITNSTFNNLIIRYSFNIFFITNINTKKR